MYAENQIKKHEKAIKLLMVIQECDKRILKHNQLLEFGKTPKNDWNVTRIQVNQAIRARIENYNNELFKL